ATPGGQNNNNRPGGWGNRGKTGGGTEGQVRAEEVDLDRGAGTDSEALEDLDRGAVADSGTLEDLDCGAVADSGTLEGLGRGAVGDSGTLEDLGRGAMADSVTLEQKSTMFDSEEPGAMVEQGKQAAMAGQVEQAEREAIAGQTEQAEQGAMAGQTEQTGAKIPTVELMTSIEHRVMIGLLGRDMTGREFTGGRRPLRVFCSRSCHLQGHWRKLTIRRGRGSTVHADTSGGIGANSWIGKASGTDPWTDEASGADSWSGKASGADSWSDEASGAQCVANTLKMATAITGSTVDSGMPASLERSVCSAWLGSLDETWRGFGRTAET
ncbi:hypothetical protein M9458_052412, partial [Cirrhinus mrigala]